MSARRWFSLGLGCAGLALFSPSRAAELTEVIPLSQATGEVRVASGVEVIPRSAWGARVARAGLQRHVISHLTVHHSATLAPDARSAPARIRGYQAYHQSRGFPDIAYHFIIDRAGNVYEGRSLDFAGSTFTRYDPSGHFLPLLDGNFEEQAPSPEQMDALVEVLAWASDRYGIDPERVEAHRDLATTACPGEAVVAVLRSGELVRRVKARRERGPVELRVLSDTEGRARLPK